MAFGKRSLHFQWKMLEGWKWSKAREGDHLEVMFVPAFNSALAVRVGETSRT